MIPISREQKLTKEIDGVTYFFLPPVGDLEIQIVRTFEKPVDMAEMKIGYDEIAKEIEKEYKGKKKPKQKELNKIIEERLLKRVQKPSSIEDDLKSINKLLDLTLCNWESDNKEVPPFPKDKKPSEMLMSALKKELYSWYLDHFNLTDEEAKN
jgi:hypothetical protein